MKKEIKYFGYSASPSDYDSQDGELAMSVNLINEDGALHPVQPASELFSLTGLDVRKVHEHINTGYKHFIVVYSDNGIIKFNWCDDSQHQLQQVPILVFASGEKFLDIVGMGNTLIITSDKNFYYVRWNGSTYSVLGTSVPDLKMSFALEGEVIQHNYTDKKVSIIGNGITTTEEEWQGVYEEHNIAFNLANSHYEWSEPITLSNSSLELEANTDYRFTVFIGGMNYVRLEGMNPDNQYETICDYMPRTKKVENAPRTKTTKRYTNLRIRVYAYAYDYITASITIEKGVSQSVSIGRPIDKTQENLDTLLGAINHFTKKYATDKEKFIHPFFVRYAVRLYDETYAHISAPILMIPNSGYVPLIETNFAVNNDPESLTAYAFVAKLQYAILDALENDDWKDIISGIDVFISQPIYPYNQGAPFDKTDDRMFVYKTRNYDVNEFTNIDKGHLALTSGAYIDSGYGVKDLYNVIRQTYEFGKYMFDDDDSLSHDVSASAQHIVIQVSPYTTNEIYDKVSSVQNYYLIHSFDYNDIKGDNHKFKQIPLKDGVLNPESLVNRTRLNDNTLSYRKFITGRLFVYNNRLHSFDTKYELPKPMAIDLQNNSHIVAEYINLVNDMYVYLHTSEGDKVVRGKYYSVLLQYGNYNGGFLPWFYYPDSRAFKVQFFKRNAQEQNELWLDLELKPHDYLNGSYYLAPSLDGAFGDSILLDTPPTIDNTIHNVNNVFVSEVENPFLFVDRYTTQVGCNKIYALSTAAKALSEGQFGQFPLYSFTDTGVWALEIEKGNGNYDGYSYDGADPGTYIARQPITRDVCLSAESITQLDDSVIFSTDRGIMLLSGSTSICLTDVLMSDDLFLPTELTGLTNVCESGVAITPVKFRTFLASCKMLYNYTHQRIIVYNPTKSYAYIYSLKSKLWGMMPCNIKSAINSYPECLALDSNNKVVDFSSVTNSSSVVNGLLVTKPVKLEQDILKTIQSVIQRGEFNFNDSLRSVKPIRTILYGSRDLYNWHLVWSSQDHILRGFSGTPYKYYRIALLCALKPNESVSGCSVLYEPKLTDKLR